MARWVSLIVLAAIVVIFAALFVRVMASFLLPMFLALVLVVMFRPLHQWLTVRCGGRVRVAAGLTTALTLVVVFLPFLLILSLAATDGVRVLADLDQDLVAAKVAKLRQRFGVELPAPEARSALAELQAIVGDMHENVAEDEPQAIGPLLDRAGEYRDQIVSLTGATVVSSSSVPPGTDNDLAEEPPAEGAAAAPDVDRSREKSMDVESPDVQPNDEDNVDESLAGESPAEEAPIEEVAVEEEPETAQTLLERRIGTIDDHLARLDQLLGADNSDDGTRASETELITALSDLQAATARLEAAFHNWEWDRMGGGAVGWIKLQANPSHQQLVELRTKIQAWLLPLALSTPQFLGSFLGRFVFGLFVLVISLYYFLADGPSMVAAVMRLSPLDDRYERRMLTEFDTVSRAMVVATLLAAIVQGLLAGVGYFFAGLEAVFLLTVVTMILALVPFVGAASVWGMCSVWLLIYEERTLAAALLALYGMCVVSAADNVIKPIVLHGRSKIHPLLALLSVLGGVGALGPIGIFVGPMVVAFLQALLEMLRSELESFEAGRPTPS